MHSEWPSVSDLLQVTFSFGISWYLLVYVRRSLDDVKRAIDALLFSIQEHSKDTICGDKK
jgi:hypothetical protein